MHIWCWDCCKKKIDSKNIVIDSGHVAIQLDSNFYDFYPQKNVEQYKLSEIGVVRSRKENQVALFYLNSFVTNQHYEIKEAIDKNLLLINKHNLFESSNCDMVLPIAYDFEFDINCEIQEQMGKYLMELSSRADLSLIYHLTKNNCMTFINKVLLKFKLIEYPIQYRLYPESYRHNLLKLINNGQFCGRLKQILKKSVGINKQRKEFCWIKLVKDN